MGNQIKKYIVTEEYLRSLIESEMLNIAFDNAKIYEWTYYQNAVMDFIDKCSKEDGTDYKNLAQIVDAEMAKLKPIEEGDII